MKNLICIVGMLIVLLVQSISESGFYLWYELNPESFTERFCENTDRPELQCNGKCHLKKVQAAKQETPVQLPKFFENLPEIVYVLADPPARPELKRFFIKTSSFFYNLDYRLTLATFFWHPPD